MIGDSNRSMASGVNVKSGGGGMLNSGMGSLKSVLIEACVDGRLVRGVYQAAQVLEKHPDKVMLCVLPQNHLDDAEVHLHSILIEAYCLENNIPFIKVDNEEKLTYLLSPWAKNNGCKKKYDLHCLLIKNPKLKMSAAGRRLLEFYKETYSITLPLPILELPV